MSRLTLFALVCLQLVSTAYADFPLRRAVSPRCVEIFPPIVSEVVGLGALSIREPRTEAVTIDLLIAYAPDAVTKVGSIDGLTTEFRRMVHFTNEAHRLSGTGISYRLVYIHPLTTAPTGIFSTDLQAAAAIDGVWDELRTLREEYKADMVSVIVTGTEGGTLCGLGYLNGLGGSFGSLANSMVSVVSISSSCPRGTLAHEIGHNMGSAHDEANASTPGWQAFSFGYNFKGSSGEKWHTLMAVTNDRELPYFSTPLLTHDGRAIGIESENDNVTSLALSSSQIAALAESLNSTDLSLPIPVEPDKIKVSYRRINNGRKIRITTSVMSGGIGQSFQPVAVYFSRSKKGKSLLRAFGRTNSTGKLIFNEVPNIAPGVFYKACYLGSIGGTLCSKPVEIAQVD